jgi:hypothetical protein
MVCFRASVAIVRVHGDDVAVGTQAVLDEL